MDLFFRLPTASGRKITGVLVSPIDNPPSRSAAVPQRNQSRQRRQSAESIRFSEKNRGQRCRSAGFVPYGPQQTAVGRFVRLPPAAGERDCHSSLPHDAWRRKVIKSQLHREDRPDLFAPFVTARGCRCYFLIFCSSSPPQTRSSSVFIIQSLECLACV